MNTPNTLPAISIIECTEWTRSGKAITTYKWVAEGSDVEHGPFKTQSAAMADVAKKAGKQ